MNLIVVSVFLLMGYITQGGSRLAYLNYSSTWFEANDTCSRCGGRIVTWNENVSQLVSEMNTKPSSIWIGNYLINNPWIKVKGCIPRENFQPRRIPAPTGFYSIYYNNKEACQTICSSGNVFIIQGNDCTCFSEHILQTIDNECKENSTLCKPPCKLGQIPVYLKENIFECDFESGLCRNTYIQSDNDILWKRRSNNFPSVRSYILGNKSHFLFLNTSSSKIAFGRKSSFDITVNLSNTNMCLIFRYCMYGDDGVSVYLSNRDNEWKPVWKSNGKNGKIWYTVTVDILEPDVQKISFVGSVDRRIFIQPSQIAIDDILITQGICLKDKNLNCDFEKGLCGWHQSIFDGGDWILHYSENNRIGGNVLYLQGIFRKSYEYVRILSADIVPSISSKFCLQFWYQLYEEYPSLSGHRWQLQVLTKRISSTHFNLEWETIARNYYDNSWKQINLTITSKEIFAISFAGLRHKHDGHISLDDISMRERSCDEDSSGDVLKMQMCTSLDMRDGLIKMEKCSLKKHHFVCDIVNEEETKNCDAIILTAFTKNEKQITNDVHLNERTDNTNSATIGFQVAVGILCVIVVIFLVAIVLLRLKTRRHNKKDKTQKETNSDYARGAAVNLGFELQEEGLPINVSASVYV